MNEFNEKNDKIIELIDNIKIEINSNKSIIIQVPNDIDNEILISFLFVVIWKITQINPVNLIGYMQETLFYIPNFSKINNEDIDKILLNLEKKYKIPKVIDSNFLNKSSQSFYQTIKSKKKVLFLNKNNRTKIKIQMKMKKT